LTNRYLDFLAVCILLVIAGGAVVASHQPEELAIHVKAAIALSVLLLGLVRFGWAGWIGIAVAALEFLPASPIFHACLAPVVLAIVILIRTEPLPATEPPVVESGKAESGKALGWLAMLTPPLVLMQIAFGAAYRHKVWGVMPHLAGAMTVACLVLVLCMLLLQRRPLLRRPAIIAMSIVLAQVSLGITSFILRMLDLDTGLWFRVFSAAHVTLGTATLAATVSLGRFVVGDPAPHGEDPGPEK
jgi:heme A synthase